MVRLKAALFTLVILLLAFSASAQEQQVHTVTYGENLFRIAQQYGVDVDSIARANNITNTWLIDIGQQLIIPSLVEPEPAPAVLAEQPAVTSNPAPAAQTVLPLDPLSQAPITEPIAEAPAVPDAPAASIEQPQTPATETPVEYYTVPYGQSLAQIARNFNMSLDQIARLNDITNPDLIYAGQQLVVTREPGGAAPNAPVEQDPSLPSNTVTHIVQEGETLASIGQRYGISWLQIAQANNIYDADIVDIGEELLIPGGSVLANADFSFVSAPAAPAARIGTGKEIIVDLSDQRTYAYEDGKLVRNVLSSTGLPATPTVQGSFTVRRKYVAQTMTGPGYYLPDVPFVMYFYAGYALHGTYWHNNFGEPMSHGCVNLPTPEAGWFYDWTEIGTPVYVQP